MAMVWTDTRRILVLVVGLTITLVGCSGGVTAEAPTPTAQVTLGSFEVGDGRSLYVVCRGEGSPTVIFESGDGAGTEQWSTVQGRVSAITRTCAYDRGGIGQSDPVSGCRQLPDLTDDLARLLDAAEVPGPYVLVGTSGGGYIAAGFAAQHRDDIVGMVLIDTFRAYLSAPSGVPPEIVEETACDNPNNPERRDYLQVEADVWNNREEIGDIPVIIITVKYGPDADPEEQINVESQQGWLILSPRATQVVVDTGQHNVVGRDPALVIEEITKVVEAARSNP